MKKHKGTSITIIIFAILSGITEIFCVVKYFFALGQGLDVLHTLTIPEWTVILVSFAIVLLFLQYFSMKEGLKAITILARITLGLICFCVVALIVAFCFL